MKKRTLWSVITVAVAVLILGACGNKKSDDSVLKVGASPVPHAEILEHVKPLLEKEGVKLEVTTYTDYVHLTRRWKVVISMPTISNMCRSLMKRLKKMIMTL